MTRRPGGGAATCRTGWLSKAGRLGCAGRGQVPSFQVRKGFEKEGKPSMRSQPDMTGSYESRNAWQSTAMRDRWMLAARASSLEGGVWCG
jgi:hypothetical protein